MCWLPWGLPFEPTATMRVYLDTKFTDWDDPATPVYKLLNYLD